MSWRIFVLPKEKQDAVEEVLKDDVLWRQTRVFKDAAPLGGKASDLFLYLSGGEEAMKRADEKVPPTAQPLPKDEAERVHTRIVEEQENAAQGMGLLFSE